MKVVYLEIDFYNQIINICCLVFRGYISISYCKPYLKKKKKYKNVFIRI